MALWCATAIMCSLHAQDNHWSIDSYAFQYDMTIYATLTADGEAVDDLSAYEVAAFCGEECRGIGVVRTAEKGGQTVKYIYLRIRSNQQEGETITFKVYSKENERETDVEDFSVIFKSLEAVGLPSSPVVLDFIPYILGDVDNSGEVDIFDAVAVVEYYLNGAYDGFNLKAADFNGDGNVDIFDAVAIVDHYQNQ